MKKFRIVITLVALCFLLCACPNGEKGHVRSLVIALAPDLGVRQSSGIPV